MTGGDDQRLTGGDDQLLTSGDDQLVVGSSSGHLSVVCCVTGDVVSATPRAHDAGITAVVVSSSSTVLASGRPTSSPRPNKLISRVTAVTRSV